MAIIQLKTVLSGGLGWLVLSSPALGELTGDGARQENWERMPVRNVQQPQGEQAGQFVSQLVSHDPVLKYCRGTVKIGLIGPDYRVEDRDKVLEPFFLEADQAQTVSTHFEWPADFRYLKGSHRLEISCFGWKGLPPAPDAQIPFPDTPCSQEESRCDLLCPSTDSELTSCLNPDVRLQFSSARGLTREIEGAYWNVGLSLPHNYAGEKPLSCSFEVSLPSKKPGSTTVVVKKIALMSRDLSAVSPFVDQFKTLKTAYEILWNKVRVKGVCMKEENNDPFQFCHPGLRHECNFVRHIQD